MHHDNASSILNAIEELKDIVQNTSQKNCLELKIDIVCCFFCLAILILTFIVGNYLCGKNKLRSEKLKILKDQLSRIDLDKENERHFESLISAMVEV